MPRHILSVCFYQSPFCPAISCLSVFIKAPFAPPYPVCLFLSNPLLPRHILSCLFLSKSHILFSLPDHTLFTLSVLSKSHFFNYFLNQSPRHTLSVCFVKVTHFFFFFKSPVVPPCTVYLHCLFDQSPTFVFFSCPDIPCLFCQSPTCLLLLLLFSQLFSHCLFTLSVLSKSRVFIFSVVPPFTVSFIKVPHVSFSVAPPCTVLSKS